VGGNEVANSSNDSMMEMNGVDDGSSVIAAIVDNNAATLKTEQTI
jgi:hypothetical protein